MSTSERSVPAAPPQRFLRERLFRYLLFRSPLSYSAVRKLAPILVGNRSITREIHDFQMALSLRDILQTRLLLDGAWEPALTRWWAFLAARSGTVFDVGTHCGYYTLFARSVQPEAEVHSFEPNPRLCEDVRANLRINGFESKVCLNEIAVGEHDGEMLLHIRDIEPAAASVNKLEIYDSVQNVKAVSLDSYRTRSGIDHVDLMKFDIEGAEIDAIRGMLDGLREHRYRRLVIEVHKLFMSEGSADQLRDLLLECGYSLYRIHETSATPLSRTEAVHDFDQWLALSPESDAELDEFRDASDLHVPGEYARIYEGVQWAPAGI